MSQRVERYRNAVWNLLENMPAACIEHSNEYDHWSEDGKTYFKVDLALATTYGYKYLFTVAVDKITAKAEIVNNQGRDITEMAKRWCYESAVDTATF